MSERWLRRWQSRGPWAWVLRPIAGLHGCLLGCRRALYRLGLLRSTRLPVPVLVVGNVVVGGAGKTPTVIALVEHLRTRGWTPGVVSRGHGRRTTGAWPVLADSPSEQVGDEPLLIARSTQVPTHVGRQRAQAAWALLHRHPEIDIVVCDDGMQHWPLARDLTVVVFDERGVGNGWLLPAGMLREPWPTTAWGGGPMLVLQTQRDGLSAPALPAGGPAVFQAHRHLSAMAHNPRGDTADWRSWSNATHPPLALGALAGIAQPSKFFDMLRAAGLPLRQTRALPDHADADALLAALEPGVRWLCTDKDAVKLFPRLRDRPDIDLWRIPLEQVPEPAFFTALDQALDGLSSPHGRQTP